MHKIRMYLKIKKLTITLIANLFVLSLFFVFIQNATNKSSVHLLSLKSAEVPLGVILGFSFIMGSSISSTFLILSKPNNIKLNRQ